MSKEHSDVVLPKKIFSSFKSQFLKIFVLVSVELLQRKHRKEDKNGWESRIHVSRRKSLLGKYFLKLRLLQFLFKNCKLKLGAAGIRDFTVVQNYKTIKNECVKSGKLFEDPEFPPTGTWLRPKEISKNPSFFKDKTTRFDFKQGDINDTWLMAVVASLTIHPNNLFRVVCQDNKFGADYCGIVHFR